MQMKNQILLTPALLGCLLLSPSARSESLSLETYLNQVMSGSPAVQASRDAIDGTLSTAKEGDLISMPKFFANSTHTIDHRQFANSFFGGRTISDNFNLGFEKQFDFGLSAKLNYNLFNNNTTNLPAIIFPNGVNAYTSAQSQLDLTQSLWRNFFGKETRASETLAEASALASHFGEKFKLKQTLAQAETAYYRTAIANESVKLEQELLNRSKQILEWTTKRVNNHLTDKIDLLQSRASTQARALSLESALSELRTATLQFNLYRNQPGDELKEQIPLVETSRILALKTPSKAEQTDDLKAAEQSERATRASQELSLQKAQPDLALFATAAFNGVDRWSSPAISNSLTTNNPYYVLGMKFSFPLYFLETSEIRSGRERQQLAAENTTRQKVLENHEQWRDLSRKFDEARARLKMAEELVGMQKEKLEYEKYRFNLGRTTTYQVLTFEQDYAQSLISRLQIEREILGIHAQLKTFAE